MTTKDTFVVWYENTDGYCGEYTNNMDSLTIATRVACRTSKDNECKCFVVLENVNYDVADGYMESNGIRTIFTFENGTLV